MQECFDVLYMNRIDTLKKKKKLDQQTAQVIIPLWLPAQPGVAASIVAGPRTGGS